MVSCNGAVRLWLIGLRVVTWGAFLKAMTMGEHGTNQRKLSQQ